MKCIYVSAPNTQYLFVPHDMHPSQVYETICYHVICLHETLDVYCNDMYLCFLTKHWIRICPVWFVSCTSSFRHDTVWSNFISRRYAVMSFVCTKHSICILTLCIYVSAPNSRSVLDRMICIPHDMHPARVCFNMILYDQISSRFRYETICYHVICLHETLDMYCDEMCLCFLTKHSIRICPVWYASRTSSFRHDTVWSNFISKWYAVMSFVCTKRSICIVTICIHVSAPNSRYVFDPHDMHPARVRFETIQYD
jgi:hypothetical protein